MCSSVKFLVPINLINRQLFLAPGHTSMWLHISLWFWHDFLNFEIQVCQIPILLWSDFLSSDPSVPVCPQMPLACVGYSIAVWSEVNAERSCAGRWRSSLHVPHFIAMVSIGLMFWLFICITQSIKTNWYTWWYCCRYIVTYIFH